MRKSLIVFIVLLIGGIISSCQNEVLSIEDFFDTEKYDFEDPFIYRNDTVITEADAGKVATLFNDKSQSKTRNGASDKKIKKVITLGKDEPLMYVVNFENNEGYIIVSATKKFAPILAVVEKGNFNDAYKESGLSYWIDENQGIIQYVNTLPLDSAMKYRREWAAFEKEEISSQAVTTRSETINGLIDRSFAQWVSEGYTYSMVGSGPPDGMSYQQWERFYSTAQGYGNPDYDFASCSFILRKEVFHFTEILHAIPEWHQVAPYNDHIPNYYYVGCGPVAMGAIMYFYQWPLSFNWSGMAADDDLVALLMRHIGIKTNTNYNDPNGSGTSYDNIYNAFINHYNYSATKRQNHHSSEVVSNIYQGRPVLMTGYETDGMGHAWVCNGYKYTNSTVEFVLKTLTPWLPLDFENALSESGTGYSGTPLLYMSWGQPGESGNGWYRLEDANPDGNNYKVDRRNIINIKPNRP